MVGKYRAVGRGAGVGWGWGDFYGVHATVSTGHAVESFKTMTSYIGPRSCSEGGHFHGLLTFDTHVAQLTGATGIIVQKER